MSTPETRTVIGVYVCVRDNPFGWTTSSMHQVANIIGNGQGVNNKTSNTLHSILTC